MNRIYALSVTVLGCLLLCWPVSGQDTRAFDGAWKAFVGRFRSSPNAAGMVGSSTLFLREGRVLGAEYQGLADLASKRPVDADTIWHWASITKTLTGIAIMQQRDRGRLELDDSVLDYLPELAKVHNPFGKMRDVTLRHLMSHAAGFRASTWPWGGNKPWEPHEPTEWAQIVAMLPYTELKFKPGSRYSYSNPGILFLGRILEKLTGEDYEVYVDKNIFKPLAMHRSYFDRTPYHLLAHRSNNYAVKDGRPKANGLDFDTGVTVSNSGFNAPMTDMVKYLAFLMGSSDAKRQAAFDRLLKRSSLEEMWRRHQLVPGRGAAREMGLIFFMSGRIVGHTGSQKAFRSFFYVDPQKHTGCVAAFNTVGERGLGYTRPATGALVSELQNLLFTKVFPSIR